MEYFALSHRVNRQNSGDSPGRGGNERADIESARYKLATALLSVASEESRDVVVLKKAALLRLALDYRDTTPTYHELKRRVANQRTPKG